MIINRLLNLFTVEINVMKTLIALLSNPRRLARFSSFVMLSMVVGAAVVSTAYAQDPAKVAQPKVSRKASAVYSCPMHPEVRSGKRGSCPKCKMVLRRITDTDSVANANAVSNSNERDASVAHIQTLSGNDSTSARKMNIPDVEVLDQDGNTIRFYTDLIKGKTIAINFIFTNCTTICPPLAATFARVQKQMGDRVGKDVHFISISVDPVTDTPERLKAWGAKFKAGAGWTFVTGHKEQMDKLLFSLGASVSRREDHSPTVIIGNDLKGVWTRTYGLANPSKIVEVMLNVMEGRETNQQ